MKVRLHIGPHHFELMVPAEQEQIYRASAVQLNDRYNHYKNALPSASAEQIWVYVALESTVNLRSDVRQKALEPIEEKISELNELIESEIKKI